MVANAPAIKIPAVIYATDVCYGVMVYQWSQRNRGEALWTLSTSYELDNSWGGCGGITFILIKATATWCQKKFVNQMPFGYRTFYHSRHGLNNRPFHEQTVLEGFAFQIPTVFCNKNATIFLTLPYREITAEGPGFREYSSRSMECETFQIQDKNEFKRTCHLS